MNQHLLNLRYKIERLRFKYFNPYNLLSSRETIEKICTEHCSVCRYGDGELLMLLQEYSIGFQKYDRLLRKRLSEILISDESNILVCLPYMLKSMDNLTEQAYWYWEDFLLKNRHRIYKLTKKKKLYGDTQFTRPYIVKKDKTECEELFEFNKKIWNGQKVLIVEGANTCLGIGNDLMNNAAQIERIIAPPQNAFEKYNKILDIVCRYAQEKLVLVALGPTATVLAYDLAHRGYWAIDIGHIDIEYEWFKLHADKKIPIKGKYVNEVENGRNPEKCLDPKYLSEIIERIE